MSCVTRGTQNALKYTDYTRGDISTTVRWINAAQRMNPADFSSSATMRLKLVHLAEISW